jgi:beta-RFAP synthase
LLGWGPGLRRQFGGLGLMIQAPDIALRAEPSDSWAMAGSLVARVERIVANLETRLLESGIRAQHAHIDVLRAPPEHVGLGVGTQLSLAVARAVLRLSGVAEPAAEDLALFTGRGLRSGIGLHGFQRGGLIVDGGRKSELGLPPLLVRIPFPEDWPILVVQPGGVRGLHGWDECRAFSELPPTDERVTDRLCRIVLLDLLPAVLEHDLPSFGAALSELQAHVGSLFAPAQGGIYATPHAATIVEELRRTGFVGIGQSSWGPTLYAFSQQPLDDVTVLADRLRRRWTGGDVSLLVTTANNQGATLAVDG